MLIIQASFRGKTVSENYFLETDWLELRIKDNAIRCKRAVVTSANFFHLRMDLYFRICKKVSQC